jgi:hypothetical protein
VEYQRINPTTQALLTSHCLQTCDDATDIVIQWILYTNISAGDNSLFFGKQE